VALEDSDDGGEVVGVDCVAEGALLQREAGAAGMELSVHRSASSMVAVLHIWKLSQLHREFETLRAMEMTTMSIDVNRQFDFDLREITQGHQGEGPRRSAIYR